jgi:hypothetical protein
VTPDRLKALEALCEKATAGPWRQSRTAEDGCAWWIEGPAYAPAGTVVLPESDGDFAICATADDHVVTEPQLANAAFIAEARTALPEALAEIARLTERWKALKVNIGPAKSCVLRGDEYEQALADVLSEMTRLESRTQTGGGA